jgi:subtilase family serine protease
MSEFTRRALAGAGAAIVLALSVQGCGTGTARTATRPGASGGVTDAALASHGYSPQVLQRAYGVSALLRKGVDGRGETVVLPEAATRVLYKIRPTMTAFDKRYHLPSVDLTSIRGPGYTGPLSGAESEEVEDAEIVHAIAPRAKIVVMLAGLHAFIPRISPTLLRAAAGHGNVVSLSYSTCERCLTAGQRRSLNRALRYARDRHVSVFVSSGDDGPDAGSRKTRGVVEPASSPLATGVGGTTLSVRPDGAYGREIAWDLDHGHHISTGAALSASGGGVSARYSRPGYQGGLPVIGEHRGVPDVAAMADPGIAAVAVRDGRAHVFPGGGTSASAPLWAGIAALADQDAHRQLGFLNDGLYRIGHSTQYHRAFHDVTHGNNTVTFPSGKVLKGYRARPGWDLVTGWGTPNAQVLVPLLGKEVHPHDGMGL